MSVTVPDTATLLQAAADYLEHELMPTLEGYHRFQTRVSANVLRLVERELRLAPAQRDAERHRLAAMAGRDGTLAELNGALAVAVLEGEVSLTDPALLLHLRQTLREALRIHNPGWASVPDDDVGGKASPLHPHSPGV